MSRINIKNANGVLATFRSGVIVLGICVMTATGCAVDDPATSSDEAARITPFGSGTGCSQNSCNFLDPTTSFNQSSGAECSSGAFDVKDLPNGESALGGLLELRFGPNCTTNWTRFTPGNNDQYEIWVTRLSDGEWAGTGRENPYIFSGGKGIAHFSDQMYCPGSAAACVRDITTNSNDFCFQQ